ncbi:MAG: 23S rRNA (uracil(1939)-C(5))-methyltransferase RlmD [Candidatus Marinimicrobia bacterium]|nr:23S rRNA (uracil(1939)-C(5))-methyltransferase RlmD [Candidatus Neomarinimicrobiota bacterium]
MIEIKKNALVELTIESIAFGAKGIARINDFVIFVRDALPGQKVKALIIKKKAAFAEAIIREIIEESPDHVDAPCPYFEDCGGCKFQNLNYQKQLDIKTEQVKDVFTHLAKIPDIPILPALAAPEQYAYRNKMDFSTGVSRWKLKKNDPGTADDFAIGLHAPGRFDKILDIDACLLQDDKRNEIFREIRNWALENNITLNNPREYIGFLRSVIIRKGEHSGEIMVNLVTRYEDENLTAPLVENITSKFPEVSSIVNNITDSKGDHSIGEREVLLFGNSVIHDSLGSLDYEISANAFFQTNTKGAEQLYNTIVDFAEFNPDMIVWDFYSGTGSISLYIANKVKQVIGFEVVKNAVENAKMNAKRNNVSHCQFFEANLDTFLQTNQELIAKLDKPDLAIVDPPRAGLNPKFVKQLIALKPPSIIYVSCNPSTQARDIALFVEAGYNVEKIQPVDMFPHTAHIETVAKLRLNV